MFFFSFDLTYSLKLHMEEIIDDCLSNRENSARTFLIFNKAPTSILQALLKCDLFYNKITLFFLNAQHQNLDTPIIIISRISSILLNIISNLPNEANNCVGFVYQLIPFISDPSVFDLFNSICSSDSELNAMQRSLIESNFSDYIYDELQKHFANYQKINSDGCQLNESNTNDSNHQLQLNLSDDSESFAEFKYLNINEFITSLLRIIKLCLINSNLQASFRKYKLIEILHTIASSTPISDTSILNELWMCISHFSLDSQFMHNMIIFLEPAIQIIIEPYLSVHAYHIYAIEFIANMMKLQSNSLISSKLDTQIPQVLLRLIVQFPNSSNLMGSVFRLIKYGLKWPIFTDKYARQCIPIMTIDGTYDTKTAASANSLKIMRKIVFKPKYKSLRSIIKQYVHNYDNLVKNCLTEYNHIISLPYGGEIVNPALMKSPSFFLY